MQRFYICLTRKGFSSPLQLLLAQKILNTEGFETKPSTAGFVPNFVGKHLQAAWRSFFSTFHSVVLVSTNDYCLN